MHSARVAILGTGNIGTDLLIRILRHSNVLEVAAFVDNDPLAEGLARAERLGVPTLCGGLESLIDSPEFSDIKLVFDATTVAAHIRHAPVLKEQRKQVIDLTPSALGPLVVPEVNLDQHLGAANINLVTSGGQATIPIVAAVQQIAPVIYAEAVVTIASTSAGKCLRNDIDEWLQTTSRGLEVVGGARCGKTIIVLNPAQPPIAMRAAVSCFVVGEIDDGAIERSIGTMVDQVQKSVPGCSLKQPSRFEKLNSAASLRIPGNDRQLAGTKITVSLEVTGAGHSRPAYAGNLEILTAAAVRTAERLVEWHAAEAIV